MTVVRALAEGNRVTLETDGYGEMKDGFVYENAYCFLYEIEGAKIKAIGLAEAEVTKQKTEAMGTEQYAIVRVAEALASHGIKLVPDILVSGKDGGGSGMIDALIGSEMFKYLFETFTADYGAVYFSSVV